MGQILSDEGDNEEAINYLIDALRWDPKNGWALLMMGNIFAKFKDDIPTAMKYYDQSLVVNPNDNITLNNIGANLMQQGKLKEAKIYFEKAILINNQYPNTHFALAMIAEIENDLHSAFYSVIKSIKLNTSNNTLYKNSVSKANELANKIAKTGIGEKIFREYRHKLQTEGGVEIDILEDTDIRTAAKMEFAENYDRNKHVVKFKPQYPAVEHLIMHELVHLEFAMSAKEKDVNLLFVSTQSHKNEFIKGLEPTIKKLHMLGVPESSISKYCSSLFEGINIQAYNNPIDLFIENLLYNDFSELRPYQFLSLNSLIQESIHAVTDKKSVDISPKFILSSSKIYNIVTALQYKDLFGIDFTSDFKATFNEIKIAKEFYSEYLQFKDNKQPAKEYDLVLNWAEKLKLDNNFEMVNESEYRTKRADIDSILTSIEKDPYDLESKDPYKEREMDKFQKSHQQNVTNMAVTMFMVDALQFFENKSKEEIRLIAYEIAMQGTQGYRPEKSDYRLRAIPNKVFSGYHILAYYYVSWSLAVPEMVSQLQLPFDNEFNLAKTMYSPKQ